ncbi:MAG TPA: ABC transporter ATP-binding protein [Ramlibacter sp.]|nr:ABC transporter ATP-binding protein [Ramlibacter sp.]
MSSSPTPAVAIAGVRKTYGNVQALRGIDFDIRQGEFFGLLGPNGAGKSTLISIIAGLVSADAGSIAVMGSDTVRDFRAARRQLGVVPQELVFDPFFKVRDMLRIQAGYYGCGKESWPWIDEMIERLDLADKAHSPMRALSGGMKRRVLVAQALVHKPPVIVLDEPTAGVDVELRQTLWQFIDRLNKQGHTVLLTTHYLEEAEALCGRVAMLKTGRVVALERTSELLKAASSNVLRFKMDSALPAEFAGKARVTGRIVQLPVHDAHQIEQYLAVIRQAGLRVEDVEIRKADLEDVFLDVMAADHGETRPVVAGELREVVAS